MNSYSDCGGLLPTDCTCENYPPCRKALLHLLSPQTLHPFFPLLSKGFDGSMLIVCWEGDVEGVKQASMVFGSWPGVRPLDLYLGGVSLNRACSCA